MASGPRLAMVVGVSEYGVNARNLANAANDATDMAERLRADAGFQVDLCLNPTR